MEEKSIYKIGRVNELLEYIDQSLGRNVAINEYASIMCLSPRQFQRFFKSYMGENIGSYHKRRKLEKAARMIAYSEEKIGQVLYDMGFSDRAVFTRMFKEYFGINPSEFKSKNTLISDYKSIKTKRIMKAEIVTLKDQKVLYTKEFGEYSKSSEKAWKNLINILSELPIEVENEKTEYFGIIHDDTEITEKEDCRYDACFSIDGETKLHDDIGKGVIKGGKYAKFIHQGSYRNIDKTYDQIYGNWYINTEHELEALPVIEKYVNDPDEVPESELITEIYLPIK